VCLFAAHLSSASSALRIDESRIKVSPGDEQTRVTLEVENGVGRAFPARVIIELLDPHEKVRASAEVGVQVRQGTNSFDVPVKLPYTELLKAERKEFPWYRLRYRVAPTASADSSLGVEGIISISEVTPDLFELRVVTSQKARGGTTFRARVRTANPVTQRPVKGVAVEAEFVFDAGAGETVIKSTATTDGDGFASLDLKLPHTIEDDGDAELKVTAQRGAFVEKAETDVSVEQSPRVLLTTDKPLYQPGQTMHMRALIFDPAEHALSGEEVTFKIEDEEGTAAFSETLKTSRFGVASADWRIPESTRLGTYMLKLEMDDDKYDIDYGSVTGFKVSRYDLPNFAVTTKPDHPFYLPGQNAEVEVRADYLFGQPVKRGHVRVVRQTERTWNYKEQKYETEEHPAFEGELDEQGRFIARLDLSGEFKELGESDYQRFRDLSFAAYVSDPTTNRTEQRRFSMRLTKDPIHIYVNEGRFQQAKGLPLAFYLSTFYADGTPAECDVTVYEEGASTSVIEPGGSRHEVREPDRAIIKVRTNRYGVAKVTGPSVQPDETRHNIPLRFVARDRRGQAGHHSDDFWLGYYGDERPEIRVETDKTLYQDGEEIKVELTSNSPRMNVVVDAISQGRVIFSKSMRLSDRRASLVIPASPDFRDAVTVSATSAAPSGEGNDEFSFGARTVVYPRDRELKLDVSLSRKSYQPGEEASARFAVRSSDGRRAVGALGVVVFDKAVEERARTDGEFSRGFGFAASFYDFWYGEGDIAGITQRDIEQLNLSRTQPEGLEAVAEMLYNGYRIYDEHKLASGTEFEREQSQVFSDLIEAQLSSLSAALKQHYAGSPDYPADEASFIRALAQEGVDFAALRDPWGKPFRPRVSFAREMQKLDIYSNGADERAGTDDDFIAARFAWPYFRADGEAINRVAAEYHKRTGGFVHDLSTLREELRREHVDLDTLRDRWGQPYRIDFDVSGTNYVITVTSGGPNKSFEPRKDYASDDFDIWVLLTDYFAEPRKALDEALANNLRESGDFPQTQEAFAKALSKSSLRLEEMRDGWGHPIYATFSKQMRFTDRIALEDRRRFDPVGGTHETSKPVTQALYAITLRSNGPDGKTDTPDDFTLAYYTSVGAEQSAQDAVPQPVEPVTTFSGGTGAITGTVTDPMGAVVAGATVTAKHNFASLEFSAETNDNGTYLLRNLPSGVYTLTFNSSGFMQTRIDSVRVLSSNLTKVDVTLDIAATTETVTVTAEKANTIETTSTSVAQTASHSVSTKIPLSTPRLREFFPETLLWQPSLETDRDGLAQVRFKLADNITTWKMSVIASTEDGKLGTVEREFLAFQPFFVEHDPPRVLTEGDEIALPVVLRNYLERAQGVDVEMKPESWFTLGGPARQHTDVPAGDSARPTFDFRAVASIKDGKQRITAYGSDANDAIEKPVTVHPDGEERAQTDATVFSDAGTLSVNIPADTVRGSVRGELKIYPNLTTHVIEGVEAIMQRPYGCGEQTISSTYPSILVLKHFDKTRGGANDEVPPLIARARHYTQLGYERLLGYRAPGGGFTYWGRGEPNLALTAYALRFLSDASRVIEVDQDVIRETRAWLISQQHEDGSWPALHWWSKEEDTRQTALNTAFISRVLAATQKTDQTSSAQTSAATTTTATTTATTTVTTTTQTTATTKATVLLSPLQRALRYLAAQAERTDEPYLIASFALAATDAGDAATATRAVARLRTLAHEEGTGSYWSLETNTPFYGWGLAGRIETTALTIQALARAGASHATQQSATPDDELVNRGLLFLLRNKDRYGVWYSTQATINVFDALVSLVADKDPAQTVRPSAAQNAQANDTAEVFVNGRRAGQVALPPVDKLTAPLTLDLSTFLGAGDNHVEVRRNGPARQAQAQLVTTFYVPWPHRPSKTGEPVAATNDNAMTANGNAMTSNSNATTTTDNAATTVADNKAATAAGEKVAAAGGESAKQSVESTKQNVESTKQSSESIKQNGASALRLSVVFDHAEAGVNQEVTCSVEAERIGHRGYGMLLAEVGLPPGADVDRATLERTMRESGWAISSYDVLPDRLVLYLWPQGGAISFNFKFRPRYGLNALTAPSQLYDYYNPEAHTVVAPTRFVIR
jgi:hypothetical protein